MRRTAQAAWPLLSWMCVVALVGCHPNLEGASCSADSDCPRSQYCSGTKCREGRRVVRTDAGTGEDDGGSGPPVDAGTSCDADAGCTLTVSATPNPLAVDGRTTLSCTVRDGNGSALPGILVSLSVGGVENTLDATSGQTDEAGTFSTTLGTSRAENKHVVAAAGNATASVDVTFTHAAPETAHSSFKVTPAALKAGATASLDVVVRDALGNAVPHLALTVTVSGSDDELVSDTLETDDSGAAGTSLRSTRAETKSIRIAAGPFHLDSEVTFTPAAPSESVSTLVASPATLDAGETAAVTLTVKDAFGNVIPGAEAQFTASGSGNEWGDGGMTTDDAGVLVTTLRSTVAEAKSLEATVATTHVPGSLVFTPLAPDPTCTTLIAQPASVHAREQASVTLHACDVFQNPVPGAAVSLTVSGSQNTTGPSSGTTAFDGNFSMSLSSTRAETKSITATIAGFTRNVTLVVTPAEPSSAKSVLALGASSLTAGASTSAVVTVRDVDGNPVPGAPVSLAATGSENVFTPPSGKTDSQGHFTASFTSNRAEAKTVTATVGTGGAPLLLTGSSTFTPGPPSPDTSSLGLSLNPVTVSSGSGGTTLTVTVKDALGNAIQGQSVVVTVSGTNNAVSALSGPTNAAGVATATLSSTRAEEKTITAQFSGITLTQPVTFLTGAVLDATSSLSITPANLAAGETATATVSLNDQFGNPVPGQSIQLSSDGSGNTFGVAAGTSNAAGSYSTTFTSTKAESKKLTATVGAASLTANVVVSPAPPSGGTSTVTAVTPQLTVGQGTSLTVTVQDAFGNPVPNQGVTLAVGGSVNTLSASGGATSSQGTWSTTLSSTRAETKQVTATFGAATASTTVTFVPGAPSITQSSLVVTPASGLPGGPARAAEATVRDGYGNPIPGLAVALSATGGAVADNPASPTDAQGKATGTVSSNVACTSTVAASVAAAQVASTTVTFLPPGADASTVRAPLAVAADGVSSAVVTVTARDALLRPVSNATVTLAYSGAVTPVPTSTITDAQGVASFSLVAASPTTGTLSATAQGVVLSQAPTLVFLPSFTLGGAVSGLTGAGLVLSNAGLENLPVASGASSFTFGAGLASGAVYDVRIAAQPTGAWCNVASGSGAVAGANVTGVAIECHPRWSKVVFGGAHALALASDGSVWAWGTNTSGQLGLGDTAQRLLPVKVADGFSDVAAGAGHSLALRQDGTLWAWGLNANGQLGLNDTNPRNTPTQVGTGYASIAAGDSHALAVKTTGTLWAWGLNSGYQLGLNDTTQRNAPVQVGTATGYATAAAGSAHSLAVKTDGTLWSWGLNPSGQLGLGDTTTRKMPTQVGPGYLAAAAAGAQSYALKTGGVLYAWGANGSGRLGVGDMTSRNAPTLVGSGFATVAAGSAHVLAVKQDGSLWAWGDGASGQLGNASINAQPSPIQVGTGFSLAAAGPGASLALSTEGAPWVCGDDSTGMLGLGDVTARKVPVRVGAGFSAVAGGQKHTLALKSDGSLWAWGDNTDGQLGLGDNVPRALPTAVGATFTAISAGGTYSMALKADGSLWAWGSPTLGKLGLGVTSQRNTPVQVGTGYAAVAAGSSHTLALKTDGSLWAWGDNSSGQLGLGDTTQRSSPAQVGTGFAAIGAGFNHSGAVKANGSLWTWGNNDAGQLGLNDLTQRTSPFQVGVDTGFAALVLGAYFSAVLKPDGTLRAWGDNGSGQLGTGNTTSSLVPLTAASGFSALAAGAGATHTLALKPDGTLWGWGANASGQVGNGAAANQPSPGQLATTFTFTSLARGFSHSAAIRDDGSLWAWGGNGDGQLGLGVASRVFVLVPGP